MGKLLELIHGRDLPNWAQVVITYENRPCEVLEELRFMSALISPEAKSP